MIIYLYSFGTFEVKQKYIKKLDILNEARKED